MTVMNLIRSVGQNPRFHGNGMIQVYLTGDTRLHVWTPDLPRFENHNAMIHDHTFHMRSAVLVGRLRHRLYSLAQNDDTPSHRIVRFTPDTRKSAKGVTVDVGDAQQDHRIDVQADCEYYQASRTFHSSEPLGNGDVATVMFKRPDNDPAMARIICPIDKEPTDAFDPVLSPSVDQMFMALEGFFHRNNIPVAYLEEAAEGLRHAPL